MAQVAELVETASKVEPDEAPLETVEAVIISGPRKGQIVQLPNEIEADLTGEEARLLNEALDEINTKLDHLTNRVHFATENMKQRIEANNGR